ncbi:rod shape-determining protein MreC [Thiofilum flexile]|uniref:rod shape-determining protein MreC n=1 Tax=Thiofilum flexile TaxID=125627 RepID=UPI000381E468|nr:rod shape-determining protein MreC [Thiofilum flexile]
MEADISNSNFHSAPGLFIKFILLVVLALTLMAFDYRKAESMAPVRTLFSILAYPLQWSVDVPFRVYNETAAFFTEQSNLTVENNALKDQLRLYEARYQDMVIVEQQNERLREELKANPRKGFEFSMAEILSSSGERVRRIVTLNKGSRDGVYEKQVVLAGGKVYGQVLSVSPFSSTVIQLTDQRHAIPVRNQRTGFTTLALGTGKTNTLRLDKVVIQSEDKIQEGDIFVTSGLDELFPPDFPVARVIKNGISYDQSSQFAQITTESLVDFEQTREVLLVWPKNHPNESPLAAAPADGSTSIPQHSSSTQSERSAP